MEKKKVLALVAHDNMKRDLAEWVDWNSDKLYCHHLICTGTTGKMVEKTLRNHREQMEEGDLAPELEIIGSVGRRSAVGGENRRR